MRCLPRLPKVPYLQIDIVLHYVLHTPSFFEDLVSPMSRCNHLIRTQTATAAAILSP